MIRTFGYSHPEMPREEVPVGQSCGWCAETFVADDLGVIVPHVGNIPYQMEDDGTPRDLFLSSGGPVDQGRAIHYHRDCFMRQVVGSVAHQRGACSCFGGTEDHAPTDLTARQEAVAAVALFRTQQGVKRE